MPTYVVVGGSRGVGLEIVRQLAADPENTVFATARNVERSVHLIKVAQEALAKNVVTLQADVVDHRSLKAVAEQVAVATGGSLDVLIHNAAKMDYANGNQYRSLTEYDSMDVLDTEFIEAFKVNTLGAIHSVDAFLPLLRKGSLKRIIIISTGGGERDIVWKTRLAETAAYGVTKCAENMVMAKYAASLEKEGFIVAAISPGNVDVSATALSPPTAQQLADLERTMGRIRELLPNYPDKPLTPEQSVKKVLEIMNSLELKDTATFRGVWG
ncbi:NAD(P)-binding protein [Daedalea quercina L-15889]|uniref:NAD(P)-binding protein n=1 Tax=Daedalea quercina L-15889 TaxID=1314783 RepID=A0A165MVY2_9APHY|nr:NAD(P)-binding protein [Daedalea quercina L-15889]